MRGHFYVVSNSMERETGIEPATNGLGSRYSTIELLPLLPELYLAPSPQ
jgi:hypothetical protein